MWAHTAPPTLPASPLPPVVRVREFPWAPLSPKPHSSWEVRDGLGSDSSARVLMPLRPLPAGHPLFWSPSVHSPLHLLRETLQPGPQPHLVPDLRPQQSLLHGRARRRPQLPKPHGHPTPPGRPRRPQDAAINRTTLLTYREN